MAFQSIIAGLLSFVPGSRLVDGGDCLALAQATVSGQTTVTALSGGAQAISANNGNLMQFSNNEVTTVAAGGDSVILPFAIQGKDVVIVNSAAANSMNVFANPAVNPITGVLDQMQTAASPALVSNSTAIAVGSGTSAYFVCARNGVWKRIV